MSCPTTSSSKRTISSSKPANKIGCLKRTEEKQKRNPQQKNKSNNSSTKKLSTKQHPKQCRRVEVLDTKLIENTPLPPIHIKSETCEISLDSRIQLITGIPKTMLLSKLPKLPISKSITTISENELNHPKLQSSLTLLQTVEEMKKLEIDTSKLTNLKLQDRSIKKNLEKKVTQANKFRYGYQ